MFLANKLNKGAGVPTPVDAQFNYVTMLLHGDGTNGAQNNTFLDSSTNTFTITRNGNTTQGSFSPYGSNWSNYFGGANNLFLATATALGTSNVTVEFWFYPTDTSATYYGLYDGRSAATTNTGLGIFQYGQTIQIYGNGLKVSTAASAFTGNTWTHFAVVRTSGTCQIYINGVASGSSASYSDDFTSTTRTIGSNVSTANVYTGYISNLREVTSALYSGTFTPSTTPLTAVSGTTLLTCQSNRFIDNSTNSYAITTSLATPSVQRFNPFGASTAYSTSVIGGSGYFDGTGDYLSVPTGTALNLSTGDFTIEGWVYPDGTISYLPIFSNGDYPSTAQVVVQVASSNAPSLYMSNGSGWVIVLNSSINVNINSWNHIAVTGSGTTYTVWVNGVSGGSSSASFTRATPASTTVVGRLYVSDDLYYAKGYITNVRVVKGTALYTTTFTPPTAPLTAVSGTSLLTNFTNGAIFDNAMMNDLETVGNAQISTSVVKFGTGSIKCTGDGNTTTTNSGYLLPNSLNSNLSAFGTGNFTIEFWLYLNNTSGLRALLDFRGSTETAFPVLYVNGGTLYYYVESDRITGSSLSTSTWYHIALCRSSGSTKLFVNGTQSGSTFTDSINYANASTRTPVIGANSYTGGSNTLGWYALDGNIDDLRITKGYARYTATFTPPTQAFPNIGPV